MSNYNPEVQAKYRQKNLDKIKAYQKEWREKNRERIKPYHRAYHFKSKYGLGQEDYEVMLANQQGLCAICSTPMDNPQVDHCHKTDVVRGFLCRECNFGLGVFKDDINNLRNAIRYLEDFDNNAKNL